MAGKRADKRLEENLQRLQEAGLRKTRPRREILGVLLHSEQPLSAESVHRRLPHIDLATVYRNLEAFMRAGLLQGFLLERGKMLYEAVQPDHHHHHIICRRCERAECVETCAARDLETLAQERGYSEVSHVLEVFGLCADCRRELAAEGT